MTDTKALRAQALAQLDFVNKVETIVAVRSPAVNLLRIIKARAEQLAEDERVLADLMANADDYVEHETFGMF